VKSHIQLNMFPASVQSPR